jgi:hypothetical protein
MSLWIPAVNLGVGHIHTHSLLDRSGATRLKNVHRTTRVRRTRPNPMVTLDANDFLAPSNEDAGLLFTIPNRHD